MANGITLDQAQTVVDAARGKARDEGLKMNIAAVDAGNNLSAFAGGVPLTSGDTIVGAVGVSGGTPDQDQLVAEAGAGAL
jgi:uncharacterized protein GlcG (DUF336 family)